MTDAGARWLRCGTVLLALSALWALMTLWDFGLPGLYLDEVNHYAFIPGVLSEEAARLPHYRLPDNWLDLADGTRRYPILGGTIYNTVLRTYLALPFFLVTGFSVEGLRIFSALMGLAALLASASLVGRVFGWLPALLFGVVIALDPTNVFSLRAQGGLFWLLILFASIAGHALLVAWQQRAQPPWWTAIVAGASIALAVASYFVGAFVALPLVICGIVVYRRHPWRLVAFLVAGIVAYAPVIYSLVSIYLHSPQRLANFGHPSLVKERLPMFAPDNVARVIGRLQRAWGTYGFAGNVVGRKFPEFAPWRAAALLIAAAGWLWVVARGRLGGLRGTFLAIIAIVCVTYVFAMLRLGSLNLHHLVPFVVFLVMAVCCLVAFPGVPRVAGALAVALLVTTNAVAMTGAHTRLRETGGHRFHNEAYTLPASMMTMAYPDHYPVFAGWGFHLQFLFLTRGERPYTFMRKPVTERIERLQARHGKLAVFVDRSHRSAFLKDFKPESEVRIRQRSGHYLYSIMFLAEDAGEADRPGKRPRPAKRAQRPEANGRSDTAPRPASPPAPSGAG